jgi:hypothetical protein
MKIRGTARLPAIGAAFLLSILGLIAASPSWAQTGGSQ